MNLFIVGGSYGEALELGAKPMGSGLEGVVWDLPRMHDCAVKVYSGSPSGVLAREPKIQAMLSRPPETLTIPVNGTRLPLLAWPTHVVHHGDGSLAGFLMRKVDLKQAAELSTYMRVDRRLPGLTNDDLSLPRRLELCRNLAGVIADLHRQGHYVVDFKPQNIHVFRDTAIPCILDTDGFSIGTRDGQRFGAMAYTPEYASPELNRGLIRPDAVTDDLSDRFSLALLVFSLLNGGIHPFQGVVGVEREQNENAHAIRDGLYPYGLSPHPDILPKPGSIHESFPLAMRRMFDRAFSGSPTDRPSATDWRDCLQSLRETPAAFARCANYRDDALHIHFAGSACPECSRMAFQPVQRTVSTPPPPVSSPQPAPAQRLTLKRLVAAVVLLAAMLLAFAYLGGWLPGLLANASDSGDWASYQEEVALGSHMEKFDPMSNLSTRSTS